MTASTDEWFQGLWQEIAGNNRAERRESLVRSYRHGVDQGEPSLGWIGRSWIWRGVGYWCRRLSITIVYLLIGLMLGGLALGLPADLMFDHSFRFNASIPLAGKIIILVMWYAPAIPAYLAMHRRLRLYGFLPFEERSARSTRFMGAGPIAFLAIPFFPVIGGMVLGMFTATLGKNFAGEDAAREAWCQRQEVLKERAATGRRSQEPGKRKKHSGKRKRKLRR